MIFHLAERALWARGEPDAPYRAPSLETEGFIHASTAAQVMETARRFYAGRSDLVLLAIDPAALTAELRWEAPMVDGAVEATREGSFPHVYGPIDRGSVRWTAAMEWRGDAFLIPQQLERFLRP